MAHPVEVDTAVRPTAPEPSGAQYEETMLEIWRDILGRPDIGVLDDFFDLDGNSIHAVQVIARIRETYGVSIRAVDFFESPTVAALAAAVASRAPAERPTISRRPPDALPVLSFDQQRLWLADQLMPGAYNVHGRRRMLGPLDIDALDRSVRAIIERHETLRTRLPDVDGEPLQVVDDPRDDWRLAVADVSDAEDRLSAALRLADEDALRPFDMAAGPLFRCLLVRLSENDHVLGITAHHTVCDDWSVTLFVQELSALYRVGGDVARADVPELPIQYRDFAVWQQQWLASDVVQRELEFWRQHLAGAPPRLTLPTTAGPSPSRGAGHHLRSVLSTQDTTALHEVCRAYDLTVFIALLAAFAAALGRRSGQTDVVIGVPITGRTDPGTKNLIGLFYNTLPLRVDLSGSPTLAELLARARDVALGGYSNADAPLDLIVRHVRAVRIPDSTPLFQAILNVVDRPKTNQIYRPSNEARGDVTDEAMDGPVRPSKLDLVLTGRELDGALEMNLEFDSVRYEAAAMRALLDDVGTLLRMARTDPTAPIFSDH
jgi:acyl carrier protein